LDGALDGVEEDGSAFVCVVPGIADALTICGSDVNTGGCFAALFPTVLSNIPPKLSLLVTAFARARTTAESCVFAFSLLKSDGAALGDL
jgi:hypothetical protein